MALITEMKKQRQRRAAGAGDERSRKIIVHWYYIDITGGRNIVVLEYHWSFLYLCVIMVVQSDNDQTGQGKSPFSSVFKRHRNSSFVLYTSAYTPMIVLLIPVGLANCLMVTDE